MASFTHSAWTWPGNGASHTVSSVSGNKLVVTISSYSSAGPSYPPSISVSSDLDGYFTQVAYRRNSSVGHIVSAVYEMDNPTAGDHEITVSWAPYSMGYMTCSCYDITGVAPGHYDDSGETDASPTCNSISGNGIAISAAAAQYESWVDGPIDSSFVEPNSSESGYSTPSGSTVTHNWDLTGSYVSASIASFLGLPVITDCEDEDLQEDEEGVLLDGDSLNGSSVTLEIGDASTYGACTVKTTQTINSNSGTQIDFDVVLGSLSYGQNWIYLTVDGTTSDGYEINLYAKNEISAIDLSDIEPGDQVVITGSHYGAAQSSSEVYLCDAADGSGTNVQQTVSAWGDAEITITVVKGSQSYGSNYLIVYRNNSACGDSGIRKSNGESCNLHAVNFVTSLSVDDFEDGDTVVVTGEHFGSAQGSSIVYLSDKVDASGTNVQQTVSAWGDAEITITADQDTLLAGVNYLIVARNNSGLGDLAVDLSNGKVVRIVVDDIDDPHVIDNAVVEIDPVAAGDLSHFKRNYIKTRGMKPAGIKIIVRDQLRKANMP